MALDKSGVLLEGIRLANANNPFNFPPRNLVTNSSTFNSVQDRAEYSILADISDPSVKDTDIGDPRLSFKWTRNQGSVLRFTYDGFAQKWYPSPGSSPDNLGVISNEPRLVAPVPDTSVSDAPFKIFLGITNRLLTFSVILVGTEADFTNPPAGSVQLARDSGLLNFNASDLLDFGGQSVFSQRQSFFNRVQFKGRIGDLPASSSVDYFLHLNPLPATGQLPRVRIDYQRYLTPIQVSDESGLTSISPGTFKWSLDTGRIKFSVSDINQNAGKPIYYDGVYNSSVQLTRTNLGALSATLTLNSPLLIGVTDASRFPMFAELSGIRSYFAVQIVTTATFPSSSPLPGECYVNSDNGNIHFNASDQSDFFGWSFHFVDSVVTIDKGVSVQFYRSSVNTSGIPVGPDFTIFYFVEDQVVVDGLGQSPFIMLPTVPTVDGDLAYNVVQGPSSSGAFTGELNNSDDEALPGLGYKLNLDQKQLQFQNRKTVQKIVNTPTPIIKLDDGIVNKFGLVVKKNGVPIIPGVDFNFDETTGELHFLESIGISDPSNILNIAGNISLPNSFIADGITFNSTHLGKYLYISTGPNIGVYEITSVFESTLFVSPNFVSAGSVRADVRESVEVLANNFWEVLTHPLRKMTVARGTSVSGPFTTVTDFSVLPTISQVNIPTRAAPGDVYRVQYEYVKTGLDGTTSIVSATELAVFRIRQESAATIVGSATVTFNPEGRTVSLDQPIEVYVNGVTQKSSDFQFIAPSTLVLKSAVGPGQIVKVNYWVNNAIGGETSFQLQNSPLNVDLIQLSQGQTSLTLNGNFSNRIFIGTAVLADKAGEVFIVEGVTYSSSNDTTTLTFDPLKFSTSVNETYHYSSSSAISNIQVDVPPGRTFQNSSSIIFTGNNPNYKEGTILILDTDAYRVLSAIYDSQSNVTIVTLQVGLKKNYISPSTFYSLYPILFPTNQFLTRFPIDTDSEFILVRMASTREVMTRGVDYTVDGNTVTTSEIIGGQTSLISMYVANSVQSKGTIFEINYAYAIAPNSTNGIAGQRLQSTYNLYSPDNFFYRIETVNSFLPEVQDLLRQSSQSNGVSGPNTRDATGRTNKDEGSASPYFAEQHLYNLDYSITQLLKFYNDLINHYEDMLSDMDGRIIGGEHGRFRFDGNLNNPPRNSYSEVTNDIDDRIILYFKKKLTGFFTFDSIPVYVSMSDVNSKSRLYPSQLRVSSAINNLVGSNNNGEILGTVGTESLTSVGNFVSTPATASSNSIVASGGQTTVTIASNGDFNNMIPAFEVGTKVSVFDNNGVLNVTGNVTAVGSTFVTLSAVSTLVNGILARDTTDPDDDSVSRYKTGFDIGVNNDTGEIINITNSNSVFPDNPQVPINGNEILDVTVQFLNKDTTPKRIPVLDGLSKNDYGFVSVPPLRREGETVLLNKEKIHLNTMGRFTITAPNLNVINTTSAYPAAVGDTVRFLHGPNSGQSRTISAVLVANLSYQVSSAFPSADTGSTLEKILVDGSRLNTTLNEEIDIIRDNTPGTPSGSIVSINSELNAIDDVVRLMGVQLESGSGTAISATVFEDNTANFSLAGVNNQSYLYIENGNNYGLYHVLSATATQLVIENGAVFTGFPSVGSNGVYLVFNVEPFLSPKGVDFLAPYLKGTLAFLNSTLAWQSSPTLSGRNSRVSAINSRLNSINTLISSLSNFLSKTGKLYDTRYLWIQQRTDKKTGLTILRNQAILKRQEDLLKIVADQQKLLITENL